MKNTNTKTRKAARLDAKVAAAALRLGPIGGDRRSQVFGRDAVRFTAGHDSSDGRDAVTVYAWDAAGLCIGPVLTLNTPDGVAANLFRLDENAGAIMDALFAAVGQARTYPGFKADGSRVRVSVPPVEPLPPFQD